MQSLPRLGSLRGRGAIPPIRQGNPEGKREVLLVRDVHDRVAQREERGRLEVAIDGGEARRGAGEREARALGRRPETARARGRRPWSPLTEARSPSLRECHHSPFALLVFRAGWGSLAPRRESATELLLH